MKIAIKHVGVTLFATILLSGLTACSDATLSGSSGKAATSPASAAAVPSPAADASANASTPTATNNPDASGNVGPTLGNTKVDASANGSGSTNAGASGGAALTITKTAFGLPIDDKPVTFVITNTDDASAGSQTVTFNAGSSGAKVAPDLCNTGSPTNLTVSATIGGGGLSSLPGASTNASLSGSNFSFDPSTCIVSQFLSGGKGDDFTFTCPNSTVTTSAPTSK